MGTSAEKEGMMDAMPGSAGDEMHGYSEEAVERGA